MRNLTNSLNLLAKHQHAHKQAEHALDREYTHDHHDAAQTTRMRVHAQTQNILNKIHNPRPQLP